MWICAPPTVFVAGIGTIVGLPKNVATPGRGTWQVAQAVEIPLCVKLAPWKVVGEVPGVGDTSPVGLLWHCSHPLVPTFMCGRLPVKETTVRFGIPVKGVTFEFEPWQASQFEVKVVWSNSERPKPELINTAPPGMLEPALMWHVSQLKEPVGTWLGTSDDTCVTIGLVTVNCLALFASWHCTQLVVGDGM